MPDADIVSAFSATLLLRGRQKGLCFPGKRRGCLCGKSLRFSWKVQGLFGAMRGVFGIFRTGMVENKMRLYFAGRYFF